MTQGYEEAAAHEPAKSDLCRPSAPQESQENHSTADVRV